jgi:hypothetical protein
MYIDLMKILILAVGIFCAGTTAPVLGEDKVTARHTLPLISIKDLQNKMLPALWTMTEKFLSVESGAIYGVVRPTPRTNIG